MKRFFPGKISKVNRDGTYDIKYDDGAAETGVRRSYIKGTDDDIFRRSSSPRHSIGMDID